MFKRGEKVKVNFEKADGSITQLRGKFEESIDLGIAGKIYGIVRLSKFGSVVSPLTSIEKFYSKGF